jgi:hypothetical protein
VSDHQKRESVALFTHSIKNMASQEQRSSPIEKISEDDSTETKDSTEAKDVRCFYVQNIQTL